MAKRHEEDPKGVVSMEKWTTVRYRPGKSIHEIVRELSLVRQAAVTRTMASQEFMEGEEGTPALR